MSESHEQILPIDLRLRFVFFGIECALNIVLSGRECERVFAEAESDQVSEKHYVFCESARVNVTGRVAAHEPDEIHLRIEGPRDGGNLLAQIAEGARIHVFQLEYRAHSKTMPSHDAVSTPSPPGFAGGEGWGEGGERLTGQGSSEIAPPVATFTPSPPLPRQAGGGGSQSELRPATRRRYAVLVHDHPFAHWDLFLEEAKTLRSWRLLEEPAHGRVVPAELLPAHRKIYLDYEGPVSGDRGNVSRWDGGTYEILSDSPTSVRVALFDGTLAGTVLLEATEDPTRWTARFDG